MALVSSGMFQNVVAQNHIVLIVFKGKLQISALHPQVAKTNQ
jgi:hypothetical protein